MRRLRRLWPPSRRVVTVVGVVMVLLSWPPTWVDLHWLGMLLYAVASPLVVVGGPEDEKR